MAKQLGSIIFQSLCLILVAISESVIGVSFIFFICATLFLQQHDKWQQVLLLVVWSILAAAVFTTAIWVVAAVLVGSLLFIESGGTLLESRTARAVLAATAATGIVVWNSGVVWSTPVIIYMLLSVIVGTLVVYRSAVFRTRRQGSLTWRAGVEQGDK
jgi:hypothetical protein